MKGMTLTLRNWMFLLVGVVSLGMFSCSEETVDNIGRDTALNVLRTGTWKSWTVTVAGSADPDLNITTQMLAEGETLNFDKDGAWHKKSDGADKYIYSMPESKVLVFDGVEYQIQENLVSGVTKLTMVNVDGPVTTTMVIKRSAD
ncbi:hypothetical protein HP439_15395 [Sphingobacterium shayense]|uniref:hypothetical protein n=1 Tax=Sphingobacterium shayense TaxID=626343 RepID=UPI001552A0C6|nr:hypothetical protein [Sphingobacterium shayense]NQD72110.1 hypothetical protein [Sphingobacterium shayense]